MKKNARPFNEDNWPKPDTTGGEPWPKPDTKLSVPKPSPVAVALTSGIPMPDQNSATWKHVFAFACVMEFKLSQNRRKGDSAGWRKDGANALQERLDDEVEELAAALGQYYLSDPDTVKQHRLAVWLEAADVANFAMMIADCIAHEE